MAGTRNLHQVNTQEVAYILLAKHYAARDFGLAVSSYWSPLLSWLLALDSGADCGVSVWVAVLVGIGVVVVWSFLRRWFGLWSI